MKHRILILTAAFMAIIFCFAGTVFADSPEPSNSVVATNRNRRPMLTIIDDDGREEFYQKWIPIITEKQIPVSTAVVVDFVGTANYMSWETIQICADLGADILCHTKEHLSTNILAEQTVDQIAESYEYAKSVLEQHGYDSNILVYSGASGDLESAREAARRVFRAAFCSAGNTVTVPPLETYRIRRYVVGTNTSAPSLEELKLSIDNAIEADGWIVWMTHSHYRSMTSEYMEILSQAIDYAISKGVSIVKPTEALQAIGNILDAGDEFRIAYDGQIHGTGVDIGISPNRHNFWSPVDKFADLSTTREFISSSAAGLFPKSMGGILTTMRYDKYAYQTFYPLNDEAVWYRVISSNAENQCFMPLSPVGVTTNQRSSLAFTQVGNSVFDTTLGKPIWLKEKGERTITKFVITHDAVSNGVISLVRNGEFESEIQITAGMSSVQIAEAIAAIKIAGHSFIQVPNTAIVYCTRVVPTAYKQYELRVGDIGILYESTAVSNGKAAVWVDASGNIIE